jgi:hypothetical protein
VMFLEKAVETPYRRERPGGAALGEPSALQLTQEAAEAQPIQCGPFPLAVVPVAKLGEGLEIAAVRLYRVGRNVTLLFEMLQVLGDFWSKSHVENKKVRPQINTDKRGLLR